MVLDYGKADGTKRKRSTDNENSETTPKVEKVLSPNKLHIRESFEAKFDCDLALITEEVVDGMAIGHRTRSNPGWDDDDVTELNRTLVDLSIRPELRRVLYAVRPAVETVLDIQTSPEWNFYTQPGAFRRIVMNLYGNSLKYTKHGYITVSLRIVEETKPSSSSTVPQPKSERPSTVRLTVTDTGQGISPVFLRRKVFTPFSQENSKSAGSGFGLSIVKSLVNQLGGDIDIKSILNVGTIVTVTCPMWRSGPTNPESLHPPSRSQYHRSKDPSVIALKKFPHPPQVAIYEPTLQLDSFGQTQGALHVQASLFRYLSEWFHFPTLRSWDFNVPAKLLLIDEAHIPTLLATRPDFLDTLATQRIIILAANSSRQAVLTKDIQSAHVEVLCKPFGPYKLARTIFRALEKAALSVQPIVWAEYVEVAAPIFPAPTSSPSQVSPKTEAKPARKTSSSRHWTESRSPPTSPRIVSALRSSLSHVKDVISGPDGGFPFPNPAPRVFSGSLPEVAAVDSTIHSQPFRMPPNSINLQSPPYPRLPMGSASALSIRPKFESIKSEPAKPDEERITPSSARPTSPTGALLVGTPHRIGTPLVRRPRLLLVDDNKINLHMLHTFIRKKGFDGAFVSLAEDGAQAVDIFKAKTHDGQAPDIVFMDISMPIMDGYEATRAIRDFESQRILEGDLKGKRSRAFIVALTGNTGSNDQIEAFASGVDVYMTKPVSFKEVGRLLENWREG